MDEKIKPSTLKPVITEVMTKEDIKYQLQKMGLKKGMAVLIHANLDKLGFMSDGPQTIIDALIDAVGYDGTIVMPTFTLDMVDPCCRKDVHIDCESWEYIRDSMKPFDRKLSAGKYDELIQQFLRNDGVVRSYHPLHSFAAWGKYAKIICDRHPLHFSLSKDSPLGKLYELNGFVLLLGCDYEECAMFHLSRYNTNQLPIKVVCCPVNTNGKADWKDLLDLEIDKLGYDMVGKIMEEREIVKMCCIGEGLCKFFSGRQAVTLATAYYSLNKKELVL